MEKQIQTLAKFAQVAFRRALPTLRAAANSESVGYFLAVTEATSGTLALWPICWPRLVDFLGVWSASTTNQLLVFEWKSPRNLVR